MHEGPDLTKVECERCGGALVVEAPQEIALGGEGVESAGKVFGESVEADRLEFDLAPPVVEDLVLRFLVPQDNPDERRSVVLVHDESAGGECGVGDDRRLWWDTWFGNDLHTGVLNKTMR
jgi:hypothetical protein